MIDKVIPQRLNSDVDSRFRPSTDMIDALNIAFNESYKNGEPVNRGIGENVSSTDFSGDSGVIKPINSNISIEDIFLGQNVPTMGTPSNSSRIRVIGSVSDELFKVIYFFVWSDISSQMGIYAWDGDGILPGNDFPGSYIKVYTSPKFNFPSDGFVKADVVHVGQRRDIDESRATDDSDRPENYFGNTQERIRNVIVYFTDNRNEPKKINVYDVMEANLSAYNDLDILDMITACPRTPVQPIEFRFDFDPDRDVSNFSNLPGLQFAYQYVYKDNVESALSTYSKLAVPPAYLSLGAVTGSVNLENRCVLTIPRGTREVASIRILTRYGNLGLWRVIDELTEMSSESPFFDDLPDFTYNYYNDRILVPIAEETSNMPFSNLPRIAQAQSVISDRLIYGNYVEQYPDVAVSGTATPIYNDTPQQGGVIEIEVVPVINQFLARPDSDDEEEKRIYKKLGTNRVAGYQVNLDTIPQDYLQEGTTIQIAFTVVPDNNFHFYNQQNSYHGSKESGFFGGPSESSDLLDNINDGGEDIIVDGDSAGQAADNTNIYRRGRRYFGKNKGVQYINGSNSWNYQQWIISDVAGSESLVGSFGDASTPVAYGTSAANPFILHAEPLTFSVTFQTNYDTDNPRALVRDTIYYFLTGSVAMPNNGQDFATEIVETQNSFSYTIDLGLQNGEKIFSQQGTDYRKHLIVGLTSADESFEDPTETNEPIGYFIVNNADVTFGLKAFRYMEGQYDVEAGDTNCYIGLDLQSINNIQTFTCIPYVPADNHVAVEVQGGNISQDLEGNTFYGTVPLNLINGNIRYWIAYSKEFMQQADVSTMPIYIPEDLEWSPEVEENFGLQAIDRNDPRNMYFFQANQYQNVVREQVLNNVFYSNGAIDANDLGLVVCPAGPNSGRGAFCLGYLSGPGGAEQFDLIHSSDEIFNHISATEGLNSALSRENAVFSLVDGEGGPGFTKNRTSIGQNVSWGSISPYVLFKGDIHNRWIVDKNELPNEALNTVNPAPSTSGQLVGLLNLGDPSPGSISGFGGGTDGWKKSKGFLKSFRNLDINTPLNSIGRDFHQGATANLTYDYEVPNTLNTWIEVSSITTFATSITGLYYPRSFKTNANHDFGIVYYDQRGRSGNVNYLTNAYVKGYSNQERGLDNKGRVDILISITNDPPSWATHYQIVYSPNSTVQDFVQYTTGPAFLEKIAETDPASNDEALIYVSLGHLQGINNISYSHAYGAVNKDGGKDLYTFQQGDKLRILYYTDILNENVIYPRNYVFDIVDLVTLPKSAQENILYSGTSNSQSATVSPAETGQFLVLKNNQEAQGFTYADILNSYDDLGVDYVGGTSLNNWNNKTVVEIFSPKKVQDFDERFYYEIGEKYNIALDADRNAVHSETNILLRDGDVWWRRVPVNLPEFDEESQQFPPLLTEGTITVGETSIEDDISLPKFENLILETMAFTDLIPGCNGLDWGKPKVILFNAQSLYKRSSLTFSEKNNYSAKSNNYTIFNAGKLNFKDLPNEYGAINYIVNDYDNAVVIQENKASSIPVNRNIITTAGGEQSLVASQNVLGTQKFYAGDYGADNNPESVIQAGEAIYFAHKNKREVYKLTRSKGLKVISTASMKAYFSNTFRQALFDEFQGKGKVRVVSGYDPLRDEYIITIYNMQDFTDDEAEYDPLTGVLDDVVVVDPDPDDDFEGDGPVAPDEEDDVEDEVDDDGPVRPEDADDEDDTVDEDGPKPDADTKALTSPSPDDSESYLGLTVTDSGFSATMDTR